MIYVEQRIFFCPHNETRKMSEAGKHSSMGAVLALTEGVGLGLIGVDHWVMASEAKYQGADDVYKQHVTFSIVKPALILGAITFVFMFRKIFKTPLRDPIYMFPLLLACAWLVWALHDYLWVICGSILDYKYIMNINTSGWASYKGFTKFIVFMQIILMAIIAWHFGWFFAGQR